MKGLLTRDNFREGTFKRDNYKCVICGEPAKDAHHIIERRLFSDGGYYLDNGASLCEKHHLEAESTILSCDTIREKCNIKNIVLPDHFYDSVDYDKWGNIICSDGERLRGDLFYDESVQKILDKNLIFKKYVKYPRTYHIPDSAGTKDDKTLKDYSIFEGKNVIVSLKMDGENCLDGDTLILTENGYKPIREICENKYLGKVLSYNINDSNIEFSNITNHIIKESSIYDEWYEIEIENGEIIKLTGDHYVFLPKLNCYRKVKELNENDEILYSN